MSTSEERCKEFVRRSATHWPLGRGRLLARLKRAPSKNHRPQHLQTKDSQAVQVPPVFNALSGGRAPIYFRLLIAKREPIKSQLCTILMALDVGARARGALNSTPSPQSFSELFPLGPENEFWSPQ
ncbi:hypothetical protein CEXT_793431 [Caerostris extrusa]|uniref:Uncharacterized protein n=1 Tax=Caerostris extrusa TaxID=172846 RepID=A0AAV4SZC9_CAEEX|nr:hypothetical protein CEXT_793431 [Caerostris extrusa]